MLAVVPPAELAAVQEAMCQSHELQVRAFLTDLDHRFIADLTNARMDGSVTVDSSQPVTRSLSLEVFDPTDILGLESAKSGYTAPTVMVRVWRDLHVPALGKWVEIPLFFGPVTKPSRAGAMLSIEAQDKAALASFEASPLRLTEGTNGASALRRALAHSGETRFRVPATKRTLAKDYVISGSDNTPLVVATAIAKAMGWVLFFDAEGYAVAKPRPTAPSFVFRTGAGGSILSKVSTAYWDTELVNRVVVDGATVNGKRPQGTATLPKSHELSPENLARGGVPGSGLRFYREEIEVAKTQEQAASWAESLLFSKSIQARSVSFDAVPIWHLQEYDQFRVEDHLDGVYATAEMQQVTIPLSAGAMSVGYLRRPGVRTKARVKKQLVRVPNGY